MSLAFTLKTLIIPFSNFFTSSTACQHSLGLEDGSISNSGLSAISGTATNGRLYGTSSWCALSSHDYLQINLGGVKILTGIATQGDPGGSKYVTSYSISFSEDGMSWEEYKNSTNSKMVGKFSVDD